MIAVAYLRVSSRTQSYETQHDAIERAARARGDVIAHWYEEKRSAKTIDRAELATLLQEAWRGGFQRLYVFRLDRLARSGIRDTFEVVEGLRRAGVDLVTIADGFDLGGPAAEIVLAVLAWAAKMERHAIGERIAAARERVEAQGGKWGRPARIDRKTGEKIRELASRDVSIREMAVALKIPRSTIGHYLTGKRTRPHPLSRKDSSLRPPESSADRKGQ